MKPDISIVIPVMNEAGSIPRLAEEISAVMQGQSCSWECLWVDDGSTDSTPAILQDLSQRSPSHRHLYMVRNAGQSAALAAGIQAARGDWIATLDGDGQNDPHDLPMLWQTARDEGVDMVNGRRAKRRDSWVRKVSSRLANTFRNVLTREQVQDVGCAIRVFRRECVVRLPVFKGLHRFLPTLVRLQGYRVCERPVNHRPRDTGVTKYGIHNRLWVGIADTLAICWMQHRLVWESAIEHTDSESTTVAGRQP